jgi:hypothetical protein
MNGEAEPHSHYVKRVRDRVGGAGVTPPDLRVAAMHRAAGGPPIDQPYDALARQIAIAAFDVTDAQVTAVRAVTGGDKAAFEIILSASIGAGLARWDAAANAIDGATNATG